VRDISLNAFNQVGNEIAAATELNVDLCPGITRPAPEGDEPIVEPGGVEEQRAGSECKAVIEVTVRGLAANEPLVNDRTRRRSM
jgi:hypothetical protein